MLTVQKTLQPQVIAYRLDPDVPELRQLMDQGRLRLRPDGLYEIFSRETSGSAGQLARPGDFLKLDPDGWPYPNDADFFLSHHTPVSGNRYLQKAEPLQAWTLQEPMCPEVQFLLDHKGLMLDPTQPDRCFRAELWGALETAPSDAVLLFYEISRDGEGTITDARFNFVDRSVFRRTYTVL